MDLYEYFSSKSFIAAEEKRRLQVSFNVHFYA